MCLCAYLIPFAAPVVFVSESVDEEVDEDADFGGELSAVEVEGVDGDVLGAVFVEDGFEFVAFHVLGHHKSGEHGDAHVGEGGGLEGFTAGGVEVAVDGDEEVFVFFIDEAPYFLVGEFLVDEAVVVFEVFWFFGGCRRTRRSPTLRLSPPSQTHRITKNPLTTWFRTRPPRPRHCRLHQKIRRHLHRPLTRRQYGQPDRRRLRPRYLHRHPL